MKELLLFYFLLTASSCNGKLKTYSHHQHKQTNQRIRLAEKMVEEQKKKVLEARDKMTIATYKSQQDKDDDKNALVQANILYQQEEKKHKRLERNLKALLKKKRLEERNDEIEEAVEEALETQNDVFSEYVDDNLYLSDPLLCLVFCLCATAALKKPSPDNQNLKDILSDHYIRRLKTLTKTNHFSPYFLESQIHQVIEQQVPNKWKAVEIFLKQLPSSFVSEPLPDFQNPFSPLNEKIVPQQWVDKHGVEHTKIELKHTIFCKKEGNLLHTLLENDAPEHIVKQILEKGVSIEDYDFFGYTPLLRAAEHGNLQATKLLLSSGAKIDKKHKWNGKDALDFAEAFPKIKSLLKAYALGNNNKKN